MFTRFTPEARKANQALVDLLDEIAGRNYSTPLPRRLEEDLDAVAIELTPDDLRDIESTASKITVHGARLPEYALKVTGLSSYEVPSEVTS